MYAIEIKAAIMLENRFVEVHDRQAILRRKNIG
jgi:hypothetical protein